MTNQNLQFNILTLDFPEEEQTFYFSKEEIEVGRKIHWTLFPKEIESIFPGISSNGTEFIYTTYCYEEEGFIPLEIDFRTDTPDLIKSYYNNEIYNYFKKDLKQIVHTGFINESIIWLPCENQSQQFFIYERISLKIQLCTVSNGPEIVIAYEGKSKVFKRPVDVLTNEVSSSYFNYVLQGLSIFKYEKMAKFEEPDYNSAYPVLNNKLRHQLKIDVDLPIRTNPYIKYFDKINAFYKYFINTGEFKEVFRLNNSCFLKVAPVRINRTSDESNDLSFGNNQKGRVPKYDVKKLKPYQKSPYSNIHLFFIVHKENAEVAYTLKTYFEKRI